MMCLRVLASALALMHYGQSSMADFRRFPKFEPGGQGFHANWMKASSVVVGEMSNIQEYGIQRKKELPWPAQGRAHDLFWCRGELQIRDVVKGDLKGTRLEVYWASVQPGCLADDGPESPSQNTKVWCIKQDGNFQTLLYAFYFRRYLALPFRWDVRSDLPPRERLGAFLLTPPDRSQNWAQFGDLLWDRGEVACELLSKDVCVRRMLDLAQRAKQVPEGDALSKTACGFLKAQYGVDCEPPQ